MALLHYSGRRNTVTVVLPPPISGATKLYTPTIPDTTATFCFPWALYVTTPPPAGPPRACRSSTLPDLASNARKSPVISPVNIRSPSVVVTPAIIGFAASERHFSAPVEASNAVSRPRAADHG